MASSFRALGDDFIVATKLYHELLPITEIMVMRYITRAMQLFQRQVRGVEANATLTRADATVAFQLPDDVLEPIHMRDDNGFGLLPQTLEQIHRVRERDTTGMLDSPYPYSNRTIYPPTGVNGGTPRTNVGGNTFGESTARFWSAWGRNIELYPDRGDLTLDFYYIPDLHAFASTSSQWAAWFPIEANFFTFYDTSVLHPALAPYESAIVQGALAQFLLSQGKPTYKIHEKYFLDEVERAKDEKYSLFMDGLRPYYFIGSPKPFDNHGFR